MRSRTFRHAAALAALAFAATGIAQVRVDSYDGDFSVNGSPYAGGNLNAGDNARLSSSGGSNPASVRLRSDNDPTSWWSRTMLRFGATGSGSWDLPSDRGGSVSSAASGESRVFGTWSTNLEHNDHEFNAWTNANADEDSGIDIDVRNATVLEGQFTTTTWTPGLLDNGPWDLDPSVGNVVIDKNATPMLDLAYTLPGANFNRPQIDWSDGTASNSVFSDGFHTGAWLLLEQVGGPGLSIFGVDGTDSGRFLPGEAPSTKPIAGFTGNMSVDLSGVALGSYTAKHWAITWNRWGREDNLDFNLATGAVNMERVETNITVVPEPATMIALGAGLAALAARRRPKA